jgi:hypothetical protein
MGCLSLCLGLLSKCLEVWLNDLLSGQLLLSGRELLWLLRLRQRLLIRSSPIICMSMSLGDWTTRATSSGADGIVLLQYPRLLPRAISTLLPYDDCFVI